MTSDLTTERSLPPRPTPIEPQFEHIPSELRERDQWVVWRYVPDGKKWTKIPFDASTGGPAKSNAPETWSTFEGAALAYQNAYDTPRAYDGIGYVFAADDPYCGADFDHCFDEFEGEKVIRPDAAEWIERFDSYTEFSVSGGGLHAIMKAIPSRNFKNDQVGREIYDRTRFFIFTGLSYHEQPRPIAERQVEADAFVAEYSPRKKAEPKTEARPPKKTNGHAGALYPTWEDLRAELGRRIKAHETARPNPKGNIDCRGICHDGEGTSALYYSPSKNSATCTKGCDQATILRAFGLPDEPDFVRAPAPNKPRPVDAKEVPKAKDEEAGQEPPAERDPLDAARHILAALSGRLSQGTKAAFEPEILGALALLRDQAPGDFQEAKEILRGAKVSLRDIEREIKKYQPKPKLHLVQPDEDFTQYAVNFLDDAPIPDLVIPDGYKLEADKTLGEVPTPMGFPVMEPIAFGALLITGRTRDIDGENEGIRVSWKRGGAWRHKIVDRGLIANSRELVSLANSGFPVTSSDAKLQVEYFAKFEAANFSDLPTARTTSHMGWQGKDGKLGFSLGAEFVGPDGAIVESQIKADSMDWSDKVIAFRGLSAGDDQIVEGYRREGTLDAWTEAIEKIAPYPRALSAVYTSFATPLLQILNLPNFILDLSARTSQGKTTTQRAAASVWGNPDERKPGAALQTWDITKVGVERVSAVLNGIPLILDDTKRAKNPQIIAEVLYLVTSGRGRVRGSLTGLQVSKTWHTALISSGEQPVTGFTNDGGTRMRVLEIEGAPFGRQDSETCKVVELFNLAIMSNYGHAGRRFVSWLAENMDQRDEWKAEIGRRAQEYVKQSTNERSGRLALYAATIAQAASLAHKALDLPWAFEDPIQKLWAEISGEAEDAVGARRALRYLLSWAWANETRFIGREQENSRGVPVAPSNGWIGRWDREEDFEFIGFYPHHVEDVLKAQNFNPDAVLREWRERGWLKVKEDGRSRFTCLHRLRGEVKSAHLITLLRGGIDEVDA